MTSQAQTAQALPYDLIGEAPAVRRLVDRFYDLMDQDPAYAELRALHAADLGPMRDSLSGFLNGWLGGPRDWFLARPGTCMMSAHAKVPADAVTAAQWRDAMARAMADTGVESRLAQQINSVFARLTEGLRRDA